MVFIGSLCAIISSNKNGQNKVVLELELGEYLVMSTMMDGKQWEQVLIKT